VSLPIYETFLQKKMRSCVDLETQHVLPTRRYICLSNSAVHVIQKFRPRGFPLFVFRFLCLCLFSFCLFLFLSLFLYLSLVVFLLSLLVPNTSLTSPFFFSADILQTILQNWRGHDFTTELSEFLSLYGEENTCACCLLILCTRYASRSLTSTRVVVFYFAYLKYYYSMQRIWEFEGAESNIGRF
jgi:hypothetical protein